VTENILSKALGVYLPEPNSSWQILTSTEKKVEVATEGDRWLLIVGNVPQISFHPHEAIAFRASSFFFKKAARTKVISMNLQLQL